MKCILCNHENPDNETICQYCGSQLKPLRATFFTVLIVLLYVLLALGLRDFAKEHVFAYFVFLCFTVIFSIIHVGISCVQAYKSQKIRKKNNIDIKSLLATAKERNIMETFDEIPLVLVKAGSKNVPCNLVVEGDNYLIKTNDAQNAENASPMAISDISKVQVGRVFKLKNKKFYQITFVLVDETECKFLADEESAFLLNFFVEKFNVTVEKLTEEK